ncbi:MAG: HD domain-containing protein [Patescibacteria group bacterium]
MELPTLEAYLVEKIIPDLEKGRPGFDAPHTLEVVSWVKKILEHEPRIVADRQVMLIAAYAHDWGYAGMFAHGRTLQIDEVIDAKKRHMERGAQKLRKLLGDPFFSFLSDTQKQRSIHLVAVHDKLGALEDSDEIVLMEADTLSGLDVETKKSQFDAASNKKFITAVAATRIPRFITKFGRREVKRLLRVRARYYTSRT